MKKKNIIAIILARGGSRGIKNKNLIKLKSKPLIYWSIRSCKKSKKIKSIWVSSDSEKILKVSKKFGAGIIKRPKNISGDYSPSESAWLHAIEYLKSKISGIDAIIGIQPTSPVRTGGVFDKAIKKYNLEKLDSLFTAQKISDYFTWTKINNKYKANYDYKKRPMRQEIQEKFLENGSFYIFNAKKFQKKKCRLFGKIGCFVMDKISSFQIDEFEDIELIRNFKNYL